MTLFRSAAGRARMTLAGLFVIGIEEVGIGRIERSVAGQVRLQQEGLEEPGRMRAMPLRRTRVRHRLNRLVLGRQWRREAFRQPANHPVSRCEAVVLARIRLRFGPRSEAHTSELQSLMRNSYAVFCLKKKK